MRENRISSIGAVVDGGFDTLEARLVRLKSAGCGHAELSAAALFATLGGRENRPRADAVAAVCAGIGMGYSVRAPAAVNLMEAARRDRHEAALAGAMGLGRRIGARVVVVQAGRAPPTDGAERRRLLAVERDALRRAGDKAMVWGMVVALENPAPCGAAVSGGATSYAVDVRALAEQIDAVDHPAVCGTLDFGRAWQAADRLGFDYLQAVRDFAPFAGHLHVSDSCAVAGEMGVPIGQGGVPYDALLCDFAVRDGCAAVLALGRRHDAVLEAVLAEVGRIADRLNR